MPSRRTRDRELASDRRAGWSARTFIRERHRATVKAQLRPLAGVTTAMLAVVVVASIFVTGPLQRGFVLGSGVVLSAAMVTALVVLASGTAPLMMGELAEQWTAQELRPLKEHGWKLINHFVLGLGDYDHVLVGPGGVVLVETKWGGTPWDVDARDRVFQFALEQAGRNAKQLGLWSGVAKHGRLQVEPVLAVWGPAGRLLREGPARRHGSGVVVLPGDRLEDWMLRRERDQLDADQVMAIWHEVDRHAIRRDERERISRPMPRSLAEVVRAPITGLVLALACYLLTGRLLELTGSVLLWLGVGVALIAGAEVVRRRFRFGWEARAFQLVVLVLYLVTMAAAARAYLVT
jgi:hypothetical protein